MHDQLPHLLQYVVLSGIIHRVSLCRDMPGTMKATMFSDCIKPIILLIKRCNTELSFKDAMDMLGCSCAYID